MNEETQAMEAKMLFEVRAIVAENRGILDLSIHLCENGSRRS
jgi:hypothetical protein